MIYFSEIKNKKIFTEDGLFVGRLDDLIFCYTEKPKITKIFIKPDKKIFSEKLLIPIEYLIKINEKIILTKNYHKVSLDENELFILKNVIDQPIIDIYGRKVVRVSDIIIQQKNGSYIIEGVDPGILGILRWFGIDKLIERLFLLLGRPIASSILPWSDIQPLELTRGKVILNVAQEKLTKLHPADLADYLEKTNLESIFKIINLLDKQFASKVIAELNLNYQISLLKKLKFEDAIKIISLMDPDEAIDVLMEFSSRRKKLVLESLDEVKKKELENLMKFSETSVGQFLTTVFLSVKSYETVESVINRIKHEASDMLFLQYIYVINDQDVLVGVFNLHELLLQKLDIPVYKFMTQNIIVTHLHSSLRTVLRKLLKYKISALPVVDMNKKIIGIVTIDDIGEHFLDKI
jgi:sporulation protein YlmC with PRC-barrel domain/CBS domain-containing protein